MNHSFDIEEAQKYGVNAAILLVNFRFWIGKNIANNKHFYDGNFWTYNSYSAFTTLFPYLGKKQIRNALDILLKENVLECGNYNESPMNRVQWYALIENRNTTFSHIACAQTTQTCAQTTQTCAQTTHGLYKTDVNTDINTDIKPSIPNPLNSEAIEILNHLNSKANKNFKPVPSNIKLIVARLKEGSTKDDCISVIDSKVSKWFSDPKMNEYLRPATLFNATNFAQYVGSLSSEDALDPFSRKNVRVYPPDYRKEPEIDLFAPRKK